jgi:hypothetical protein
MCVDSVPLDQNLAFLNQLDLDQQRFTPEAFHPMILREDGHR